MAAETIAPKDKAFLSMKVVQESMDAHAKRIAIAFVKWMDLDAVINGPDTWQWRGDNFRISYTTDQLFDKFIESINK